jgi:hypothetical protein
MSRSVRRGPAAPALLIRTSMAPKCSTAVATISRQTSRIGAVAGGGYHAGAIEALGLELVDKRRELVLVAAGHDQARPHAAGCGMM